MNETNENNKNNEPVKPPQQNPEENGSTSSPLDQLKEGLAKCEKEKEDYLNGWKRAKADFINYQKDEVKRATEIIKFSNEHLIKELLTVLDSFNLSIAMNTDEKFKKGVEIIYSQLENILIKHGLEPIKSIGTKFDANTHEAVEEIDSDKESGTIIEELIKGWKLNGKVIRAAKVKIAK